MSKVRKPAYKPDFVSPPRETLQETLDMQGLYKHEESFVEMKGERSTLGKHFECWRNEPNADKTLEILLARWGGGGRVMTLQQVGDLLGVTRERVRQIESRFVKNLSDKCEIELRERLSVLFEDRKTPLYVDSLSDEDSWFELRGEGVIDAVLFLGRLIEALVDYINLVEFNGRWILARVRQPALEQVFEDAKGSLKKIGPAELTLDDAMAIVAHTCNQAKCPELSSQVFEIIKADLNFASIDEQLVLAAVGTRTGPVIQTILANSPHPLHYNTICELAEKQFGKTLSPKFAARVSGEFALMFGPGIYGLKHHLSLNEDQIEELRVVAENIIVSGPVDHQWHCEELVEVIRATRPDIRYGFDKYRLNIVLKFSQLVRSLCRFIWVHAESGAYEAVDRGFVEDALIELLEAAGHPLSKDDLVSRLTVGRGLMNKSLQINPGKRLVRVDRLRWGLVERDIPLNLEEQANLLNFLEARMNAFSKPIRLSEIDRLLGELGIDNLHPIAAFSLARLDSRFRVLNGHVLHLSRWGDDNDGFSLRGLLRSELHKAETPLSIDYLWQAVRSLYGREISKKRVTWTLVRIGARYDKDKKGWTIC